MEEKELRQVIAKKIAFYRRQLNLTQAELADKINYSDKSISKWERGEGLPDIYVLTLLADIYGVSVNDLVSDEIPQVVTISNPKKKYIIPLLSVGLVWLVATVVFFALKVTAPAVGLAYLSFIFAIPVSFIILIVFTSLWFNLLCRFLSVSGLIWSLTSCIYITAVLLAPAKVENMYLIYIVAAVIQVLTMLWFWLLHNPNKKERVLQMIPREKWEAQKERRAEKRAERAEKKK